MTAIHCAALPARGGHAIRSAALDLVRSGLGRAARELAAREIPAPEPAGKLLRPLLAYGFVPERHRPRLDERFWYGALAIQMVHEASLLHDDILDDASERRGTVTMATAQGVGPALVMGDHFLTAAYRAASLTGSSEFLHHFIEAVERTVDGEVRQGRAMGQWLTAEVYERVVRGKSGALMGAASCLGPAILGGGGVEAIEDLGRDIGALYQSVDDLLDYCVSAPTGKQPLRDYRQEKWTWVLDLTDVDDFGWSDTALLVAIFGRPSGKPAAAERAVERLHRRAHGLAERSIALDASPLAGALLCSWVESARAGVANTVQEVATSRGEHRANCASAGLPAALAPVGPMARAALSHPSSEAVVVDAAHRIGGPESWPAYFRVHAKTFSLAALLFPADARQRVESLYAYCRLTDDLVDEPADGAPPDVLLERLAIWRQLSRAAFDGEATGIPVLRYAMTDAARAGVSWLYPNALLEGVEMDVAQLSFEMWSDLERYTFGVAGAVGGWMTQLFGVQDPDVLARAHSLGHGMQLTNILRDVGEDLGRGRLYLPRELLDRNGLTREVIEALHGSLDPLPASYVAAMDELMAVADGYYAHAWPGMEALPGFFRRPVAVAAAAYRGIHDEVRRNHYDNLRLRAHTSLGRKLLLGTRALMLPRGGVRPEPEGLLEAAT